MKRTICTLLSLILIMTAIYIPNLSVFASDEIKTDFIKNPYYANREVATGSLEEYTVEESATRTYNGKTYCSRGKKLYNTLASGLEKRSQKVTLYYLATAPINSKFKLSNLTDELFSEATDDSLSVSCTDGDYIRWSTLGWASEIKRDNMASGYYYYTLTFDASYNDTAAQEKQVDSVVNEFLNSTNTSGMSDYQILKKVHDFVCNRTTYCYDAVDDPYGNIYAYSAYGALVKGSCVCQGYSLAFYRICKELGYSVRVITSAPHAWNLVGLNGKYYYVDTTWDDENDKINYKFFLVSYSDLRKEDIINEHIPEEKYYDGEYYNETYGEKIDAESYDISDLTLLSNCTVSIPNSRYTYTGGAIKPQATVKSGDKALTADDFTVKYSSNTKTGYGRVNITGVGGYSGTSHRLFAIIPAKMGNLSLASSGRGVNSLTLKWTAPASGVTGYSVECYRSSGWKVVAFVTGKTTAVISSLSAGLPYKFRIRAYKSISKRNFYGAYSNVFTSCTKPQKPAVTLKTRSKTVVANWKKISAGGFEIQRCTKNNFSANVQTYKVKGTSTQKTIKSLKSKTVYYIRVRSYKVINGTTYYSPWSAVKSIKCK